MRRHHRSLPFRATRLRVLMLVPVACVLMPTVSVAQPQATPARPAEASDVAEFLEGVEHRSFRFFWERTSHRTGLIADSTLVASPSSIAAVGFGLTAICIAHSRGWVTYHEAYERVRKTLKTFKTRLKHHHGFYYHFVEMETGRRAWNSEVSSIDTSLFLAGALFAAQYFQGTEVERLANALYERVEWPWMMNKGPLLSMGWKPERGFLDQSWDWYSEGLLAYVLAIGSPTHPISPDAWFRWKRPTGTYGGYDVVYSYFGSLFTYHYALAWIDFRELDDGEINYWKNAMNAVLANRHFCIDHADEHHGYGESSWGLTAGMGPDGYRGYGARPAEVVLHDGTVNPSGMVASVPLVPYVAIPSLMALHATHGEKLYGEFGFKSGFNLDRNWWSRHYIGIDQGISVLMLENYSTGMVWDYFMRHPAIQRWIELCLRAEASTALPSP